MDSVLIDYLKSGKAWLLVGSGPSIEMGYPTWRELAEQTIHLVHTESRGQNTGNLEKFLKNNDFPAVFEKAKSIVGGQRLIQYLDQKLKPSNSGDIYKILARWPVPVYLTTNYDEEIHDQLARIGEAYKIYDNSEDSLSQAIPDFSGTIFKLHGDFKSEKGLILTSKQYQEIDQDEQWQYWRTKLTSIFQMNRVIVIGYSLSDPNIRHVIRAAKDGAGVHQPICWITPNANFEERQKYLEEYRIRLIHYDNKNGDHKNLLSLVKHINKFIPSRTTIHIKPKISEICDSPLRNNAGAPGFFVYNKLATSTEFEQKRIDITLAAIQAILPQLSESDEFEIKDILVMAGWPENTGLDVEFMADLGKKAIAEGLLQETPNKYKLGENADKITSVNKKAFQHLRGRFVESLSLRIKRDYSEFEQDDARRIAADIESSLIEYFREGGLILATMLFSRKNTETIPSRVAEFLTKASARYDEHLKRQAFCTVSLDAFINSESAEREYLGRLSQGFFAFHALGVFGDVACEKLRHAKSTVWLIDSSAQIPATALAAPTNSSFRKCFSSLKQLGIRLFTTERLFEETFGHFAFAQRVIEQYGCDSPYIIAAAEGDTPFSKSNQFMQGFIRWQAAGNPCDWNAYLFEIFRTDAPDKTAVTNAVEKIGIEIVSYENWPGFHEHDFAKRNEYIQRIMKKWNTSFSWRPYQENEMHKKALPEAEALIITKHEREGSYYVLTKKGSESPSWFISNTSILNIVEPGTNITWQPEAFVKFAATLCPSNPDDAFETILWNIAESGLNIMEEKSIVQAFGGIIDPTKLDITKEEQRYEKDLVQKYGESSSSVLNRLSPSKRPMGMIQLAREAAQLAEDKQRALEVEVSKLRTTEAKNQKEIENLEKYKNKLAEKRGRALKRKRRAKSKPQKRTRRKK